VRADLERLYDHGVANVQILAFRQRDSPPHLYYFLYSTYDK
jgi:hypothetical protein